jgi:hypothetical protein
VKVPAEAGGFFLSGFESSVSYKSGDIMYTSLWGDTRLPE